MNQSTLYSYSILSGVWNDLDYDVIILVKEYLRVYLNMRLLNREYDEFKRIAEINTPTLNRMKPWHGKLNCQRNYLRYGLGNPPPLLPVIDRDRKLIYKYYLLNTDLYLDSAPCYDDKFKRGLDFIRLNFVKNHTKNRISSINNFNDNDDKARADYIKWLMHAEESFITGKNLPEDTLWCYTVDSEEW